MAPSLPEPAAALSRKALALLPYLALMLIFVALATPAILGAANDFFDARDEANFHYPTILAFLEQFPRLDLVNYRSASAPLYHLLLAGIAGLIGPGLTGLRFASAALSLGGLWLIYGYFARKGGRGRALLFALLVGASPYYLGSAVRLSTDNLALLFAFGVIALIAARPRPRGWPLLVNILIVLAVLTRQIYIWLVGMYLFELLRLFFVERDHAPWPRYLIPLLLPIGALGGLLALWGGLTPPAFAVHVSAALNWEVPVYALSLLGLYGAFSGLCLIRGASFRAHRWWLVVLLGVSMGYLLLYPVSNAYPLVQTASSLHDRGGALWLVAAQLPNFLGSALVFWALFPLGLVSLYLIGQRLLAEGEAALLVGYALWLVTGLLSTRTYQKYYEPFTLFLLGAALVGICPARFREWVGPGILLCGLLAVSLMRF